MKRMKKFLAMLLAMVMALGMSVTVLAAPEDTALIKVTGAEAYTKDDGTEVPAATLTYLQIIVPDQTTKTGWAFASSEIETAYLEGYGKTDAQAVLQELIEARGEDGYANSDRKGTQQGGGAGRICAHEQSPGSNQRRRLRCKGSAGGLHLQQHGCIRGI